MYHTQVITSRIRDVGLSSGDRTVSKIFSWRAPWVPIREKEDWLWPGNLQMCKVKGGDRHIRCLGALYSGCLTLFWCVGDQIFCLCPFWLTWFLSTFPHRWSPQWKTSASQVWKYTRQNTPVEWGLCPSHNSLSYTDTCRSVSLSVCLCSSLRPRDLPDSSWYLNHTDSYWLSIRWSLC